MRFVRLPLLAGCAVALAAASMASERTDGGSIHGKVRTTGGEVLEGAIRWGEDTGFWDDALAAREAQTATEARDREGFRFSLFGWTLVDMSENNRPYHQVIVPFGHLRSLEPAHGGTVALELKSGAKVAVETSGGDVGPGLDLRVTVPGRGEVELPWRRIARIDFTGGPQQGREAERLFGTVTTRTGELTGYVQWDRDETTGSDVLDGEADGRDRELPFRDIAAIEPAGSSSARVVLRQGETLTLRGTNDVNGDNRGTVVRVAGLGTVTVPWDALVRVEFRPAPPSPPYDHYDGGRTLAGTARSVDGQSLRGAIVWDRDERFTWETLDGEDQGLEYRIPFALVRSIARSDSGGSDVVLRDGRKLHLEGSNDVDEGQRGVAVTTSGGGETVLSWDAVKSVELD